MRIALTTPTSLTQRRQMMSNQPTMTEHFGWQLHPFSDTWRIDPPFYSQRDQRLADQALQLLQHGKSFAVTGASGAGKSTLIEHLLSIITSKYTSITVACNAMLCSKPLANNSAWKQIHALCPCSSSCKSTLAPLQPLSNRFTRSF